MNKAQKFLLFLIAIALILVFRQFYLNYKQPVNIDIDNYANEINIDGAALLYTLEGCGYCVLAKNFLDDRGVHYEVIDLGSNKDLRLKLLNQTGQTTVPYVFIDGKFIGGYQDLVNLYDKK